MNKPYTARIPTDYDIIRDRVFLLVILNYEIIRNLDSYLSYCFNSASYIYVYLDVYGNGGVMLMP